VRQQEREPGVSGGRSSPHVKANLISEKGNGDGQSECHVSEMAVVGSKDTCTQGSPDSANINAEIKVDGDPGGVTVSHDYTTTHTWANPSLRNEGTMSLPGGDEPRIGPGSSSNNIQTQESFYRVNPYAQTDPILVNRDPKGRPGGSGRGFEGSSNPDIGRWENPDSAGGLVRWTKVEMVQYSEGGPEIDLEQIRRARAPHRRVMALGRRLIRVKRNL